MKTNVMEQTFRAGVGQMITVSIERDGSTVKRYRPEVGHSYQLQSDGKTVYIYKCKYPSRHWTFVGVAQNQKQAKADIDSGKYRKAFDKKH